jgi:AcrR family transcriptional regulator
VTLISSALTVPAGAKAQRTYRTLVAATRTVIVETGRMSGESVAAAAGVAPATFYAYFPSKDEALAAALDEVLNEAVEGALAALDVVRLLEQGLRPLLEEAVEVTIATFARSARVMRLALARLPESETVRQVYREHQGHALELLRRFVLLGAAAGHLTDAEPEVVATALLVLLQGLNNPLLTRSERDERAVEALVDALHHLLRLPMVASEQIREVS